MSTYKANYQVGLDPKITSRARIIFVVIITLLLLTSGKAIYAGLQDGSLEKHLVQPFKDFAKALEDQPKPGYTINNTVIISTSSGSLKAPTTNQNSNSQTTTNNSYSCTSLNIREGQFASNKCYSQKDYNDLQYYLQKYDSAVFDDNTAVSSIKITCSCRVQQECDFFKASCEADQKQKSTAEANMSKYQGIIQGIIAKGR